MTSNRLARAAVAALVLAAAALSQLSAQAPRNTAWFGVIPSPRFRADVPPVILGTDYGPRPATVPPGEEKFISLRGDAIRRHLEAIVGFSKWSRETYTLSLHDALPIALDRKSVV